MHERALLGRSGEDLAVAMYERQGFAVERNYRCAAGEMDVIACRGRLVVFCEVKTRRSDRFGLPLEAVDHRKQVRLRRIAATWLSERRPGRIEMRFDVVSVIVTAQGPQVTHLADAF